MGSSQECLLGRAARSESKLSGEEDGACDEMVHAGACCEQYIQATWKGLIIVKWVYT